MSMTTTTTSLQLCLFSLENHLTVKILQTKDLPENEINVLIKIMLIPDVELLECQTRLICSQNAIALFNEQFTFEINDEDQKKRLCFALYEQNKTKKKKNSLICHGCFSFGIKNLMEKQRVSGWFYLLPEDIGEFRHQRCREKFISRIHRDIANLEEYQLIIPRQNNQSLGFTIVGDSPTWVSEVVPYGSAFRQGLQSGDFIVKINGQNVSRAQKRTVCQLIKESKSFVRLTIHRAATSFISTDESLSFYPMLDSSMLAVQGSPMRRSVMID